MNVKNITPHIVTLVGENGRIVVIPPCEESVERVGELEFPGGIVIPLVVRRLGQVLNLPPQEEGTLLIASYATAQSARRGDLVVPADLVRDDRGRVVGCRALSFII